MPATIALIAHDRKKDELVAFVKKYSAVFARYKLIATGTSGQRIQQGTGLEVTRLLSGPMGGDAQIADRLVTGQLAAVIFLIDPLYAQPHEPDIQALQRLAAVHNVPLAINLATAEAIVLALAQSYIAHLIYNPIAGQGNAEEDLNLIQKILEPQLHLEVHLTTPEISAEELAKRAIAAQPDIIIASGGDGTISAVAGELINNNIPLGIIPRGTANAFAAALGIPTTITPIRSACEVILAGKTVVVDAAYCNDLPMILLAGIGFEAETVERASREAKNRWGPLAYIIAGFQQLNQQQLFETEIEIKGVIRTFQAAAVTIANAAPPSSIMAQGMGEVVANDGLLNVTIAAPESELKIVNTMVDLLGAALLGTPTNRLDIINLRTQKIKVRTNPPQKVVLDGEIIGTTRIELQCIPNGLTVLAPPKKGGEIVPVE